MQLALHPCKLPKKNIEERLGDLQANYRQQRQNSITEELLDIVSGFEALNPNRTR